MNSKQKKAATSINDVKFSSKFIKNDETDIYDTTKVTNFTFCINPNLTTSKLDEEQKDELENKFNNNFIFK